MSSLDRTTSMPDPEETDENKLLNGALSGTKELAERILDELFTDSSARLNRKGVKNQSSGSSSATNGSAEQQTECKRTAPQIASSSLSNSELSGAFQKLIPVLDLNRDSFVSGNEIDAAMTNPQIDEQEAQLVVLLKKHQSELMKLSDDELGWERLGITPNDMQEYHRQYRQYALDAKDANRLRRLTLSQFDKLDSNSDDFIDKAELARGMAGDSKMLKEAAAEVSNDYSRIIRANDDEWGADETGVTKKDLRNNFRLQAHEHDAQLHAKVALSLYDYASVKRQSRDDLYLREVRPQDSIVPEAAVQGRVGNCYLIAALSALAAHDRGRQLIEEMIRDNGVNERGVRTFTVTFPGAPSEPITVESPTEAERGYFARDTKHGMWASVLEKAYGEYAKASIFRRGVHNPLGGNLDQEATDGGNLTSYSLTVLTGQSVDCDILAITNPDALHVKLTDAFVEGRPVTAFIHGEMLYQFGLADDKTDDAGLQTRHAYAIVAYNSGSRTLTVRDPRGHCELRNPEWPEGATDGTFRMSLERFQKNFSRINFGQ